MGKYWLMDTEFLLVSTCLFYMHTCTNFSKNIFNKAYNFLDMDALVINFCTSESEAGRVLLVWGQHALHRWYRGNCLKHTNKQENKQNIKWGENTLRLWIRGQKGVALRLSRNDKDYYTNELTATVIVYRKPEHNQACQHSSMEREGLNKPSSLIKGLLTVNGFKGRVGGFL